MIKRLTDHITGNLIPNHKRTYIAMAIIAILTVAATIVSSPTPVAADPGTDEEDDSGLMVIVSSDEAAGASGSAIQSGGVPNPWGCRLEVDNPHESLRDPGRGWVQGKARIKCDTPPPPHTASIWQELSKRVFPKDMS